MRYGWRRDEFYTLKYSMLEERLEQVREIDGELAYEKMRRVGLDSRYPPAFLSGRVGDRVDNLIFVVGGLQILVGLL